MTHSIIDLEAFERTPLQTQPYEHIAVPHFVKPGAVQAVSRDFPDVSGPGSFHLQKLVYGPAFTKLLEEFRSPEVLDAFSRKFNVDLSGLPLMASVRGTMQQRDGRIHTDSEGKVLTILIYMNESWPHEGGRLRILNNGHNLDDYVAEVPPLAGTLLAFRRSDHSWHGHKPFVGPRRSIQLNWVRDEDYIDDQYSRHTLSAAIKGVQQFFGIGKGA